MSANYPSSLAFCRVGLSPTVPPSQVPTWETCRHCLRTVFDVIFYLLRTGCPWRYLPSAFSPWQTAYYHLRQFCRTGLWTHLWRELRAAERQQVGKDSHPSAAIMDSQSVKTVEESARISGYGAHKWVKGRSGTLWSIRWGCRSLFMVRPLICTTRKAPVGDFQG